MTIRNLDRMFYPRSVAVIGASNQEGVPGHLVMHNLLQGGFEGPIMPVATREQAIAGVLAYADVGALPVVPDLAVICTSPASVPGIIRGLGERGTRAAVVVSDGLAPDTKIREGGLHAAIRAEAEPFGLRLLGPNCLGLMVPGIGLNASCAHISAEPGGVAFVSQSSTISTAVLDWAQNRNIGFSHFVSLGDTADIDFGDIIDYLGNDPMTRAILLYVESVRNGRAFLSAGRGASRNKPVLVIKSGRAPEGQRLAAIRSGAAIGSDAVYDAAIRRAGMLRVFSFGELFAAVETLARARGMRGERVAILTNGCGVAVMAIDALLLNGGRLAELDEAAATALAGVVPDGWPHANPVTIADNAPPEHYATAARALLAAQGVDALMVLHAPTAMASSTEAAREIIKVAKEVRGNVLTSWMGGERMGQARRQFAAAGIATYDTPTQAVDAFMHLVRYRRNQDMLMQAPPSKPAEFSPAVDVAERIVQDALATGQTRLNGRQAMGVLSAYGIPTTQRRYAATPEEAAAAAAALGYPVVVKILSPDIHHRAEVGGVELYVDSPEAATQAAETMLRNVSRKKPTAQVDGFVVERMVLEPDAQEILIGITDDPIFGPVITFGQGGTLSEVIADRAVALPPLNLSLARELVSRTRIWRMLRGSGDLPAANINALCLTLVQVSQMVIDLPELVALEINPLFVDADGVLAVDAWMRVAPAVRDIPRQRELAIRPYPKQLEEEFVLESGRHVLLRPIRPEDEPAHYEFLSKVTPEDIRLRFFGTVRTLPHSEMARLTQIDYDREMAFVATAPRPDGKGTETLGVVRTVADLNNDQAEYAVLVRSDLKGQRLGRKLMDKMVDYCRSRGTKRMTGLVMRDNRRMLDMVHDIGFTSHRVPDDDVMEVMLEL
ncbi:MAG: GNAT family N-acetyltransferase [Rhodospirillales bacterium]|nr:GNAT family N-acetyltransferase [Rhodospirillales bacterium]